MPGHRPDRLRVARAPGDAFMQPAHVARRRAPARQTDRVRRFDEGPLAVAVDVGTRGTEAGLPAARVDPRGGPRIGRQLLGRGKPRDVPTSRASTTASVSPTPGRVSSR
jgi:hypothetical protein